jgi:hypothetical protein
MTALTDSLPLWGRAGVGALPAARSAPIPTFPQRGKEEQP